MWLLGGAGAGGRTGQRAGPGGGPGAGAGAGAGQSWREGLRSARRASRPLTNAAGTSVDRSPASSHGLADRDRLRHVGAPQQFVAADPQDVPVHGGHPVQGPARGEFSTAARRSVPVRLDALDELDGVGGDWRLGLDRPGLSTLSAGSRRISASNRMSSARLRALLRADTGSGLSARRPRYSPVRVSTLIFSPVVMNSGTWICGAGLQRGRLGSAGRPVTLQARIGLADGQLDGWRQVHVQRRRPR